METCGVPGRFIGENLSIIRDVVSFASRTSVPLAILSLDQEKALDRVDWSSIFIPCLRKLRALDLISPSLKVCGWVAGLAVWIPLWLWTGLRLSLRFLGFMWAWAISRRTTGVLEFVLLKKLCSLDGNVIFHSGVRLWSLAPLPCHGFGMLHPLFTCLRGF